MFVCWVKAQTVLEETRALLKMSPSIHPDPYDRQNMNESEEEQDPRKHSSSPINTFRFLDLF